MILYTRGTNLGKLCRMQIKKENQMLTQTNNFFRVREKSSNKVRTNQICKKYKWNQIDDKPFYSMKQMMSTKVMFVINILLFYNSCSAKL